ncbi:uncharacterized protein BP5553_07432 [Venustampulla echinocandica]|uniref:Clr5 domain-containing protein n=1 Tax=Venustampulla echinocandica TaxID=2656787 RepID=A0A370TJF4_9HELO|nr:uncharacterized protein BP5553_07432 [Venustampulla echinocandica]RDL35501.1 hypothetical protein BP5553_07432 [Venustampulla echinocandica]
MTRMETDYGFFASSRMDKDRVQEWSFVKNLKKGVTAVAVRKARERAGRICEAAIGPYGFPMSKVSRSNDRHIARGKNNERTPISTPDVLVQPSADAKTPADVRAVADLSTPAEARISGQVWTPSYTAHHSEESESSRLWTGCHETSLNEIHKLKLDAARLDAEGRHPEAKNKFQDALSGFRHLLSLTHDYTVKTAYQLAAFYANNGRMSNADEVLKWVV